MDAGFRQKLRKDIFKILVEANLPLDLTESLVTNALNDYRLLKDIYKFGRGEDD